MKFNKQSGQALLVVVLVMVVALTVGLSLTSRSIVNLRTSSEEADSQKALAAAEAGIEQALQATSSAMLSESFSGNNTTYSTEIKELKGADPILTNGGNLVLQDDGIDVWLVNHKPDGTPDYATSPVWNGDLDIYWGDPSLSDCANAAIEVAVISGPIATASLKRNAYDPCTSRRTTNKFSSVPGGGPYTVAGKKFINKATILGISSGLVARVVPIYASSSIAVDSGTSLPTQGFAIDSTGTSGAGGDRQVLRSITYFKTYDQLAQPYFMYGLFSP